MKKLLFLLFLAAPAQADIHHAITTSTQLTVNAAATQAQRIGSSFSAAGSNIDTTDGTTANTVSAGTITSGVYSPGTIAATQDNPGAAFSYSQSYTQADAVPTSAPSVGAVGNFSNVTSTAAGTAGSLAGTITSQGVLTITAGGAGTSAIGSMESALTIK
ncbi:hypothetical protein CMK19_00145 [Candidatus Poribacteria bacterium]|nr:hypothetical protein [Candidatus Poribacteria bacterium]|tara:strand:- start:2567 stop:3046 length:480 start_codon:yes stop_codon:yes gene_type:complete